MKLWEKFLISIVATLVIVIGGGIGLLLLMLTSGSKFINMLAAVCLVLIWLFILTTIWGLRKERRIPLFGAAFAVLLLTFLGHGIYKVYLDNMDEVNEQDVNLTLYEPFVENTKAASLDSPSALRMDNNLPRLDGATALYPLYSAFARACYPEGSYSNDAHKDDGDIVVCTTTEGAYRRLITGDADVIFVAGPSEEQIKMAEESGVQLKLTPIGREAFVFFVNAKNPVDNISTKDVQRVYSGEVTNWKELGGKDAKIKAFQRPDNSGSQTALIKFMDGIPLMKPPGEDVADAMGGIFTKVTSYKNFNSAIGYSFLFFATEMVNDSKIKLLSINGIEPTRENVANKTYPYSSEFYAVTARTDNPNTDKLIEWILSEQGQHLVAETGYTPITGE